MMHASSKRDLISREFPYIECEVDESILNQQTSLNYNNHSPDTITDGSILVSVGKNSSKSEKTRRYRLTKVPFSVTHTLSLNIHDHFIFYIKMSKRGYLLSSIVDSITFWMWIFYIWVYLYWILYFLWRRKSDQRVEEAASRGCDRIFQLWLS